MLLSDHATLHAGLRPFSVARPTVAIPRPRILCTEQPEGPHAQATTHAAARATTKEWRYVGEPVGAALRIVALSAADGLL